MMSVSLSNCTGKQSANDPSLRLEQSGEGLHCDFDESLAIEVESFKRRVFNPDMSNVPLSQKVCYSTPLNVTTCTSCFSRRHSR